LFSFIEDEATLMYPNVNEKELLLKKDTTYFFPVGKVDYILSADKKRSEKGRVRRVVEEAAEGEERRAG
jgi:hypothetical protein